jgi:hypothetical protein
VSQKIAAAFILSILILALPTAYFHPESEEEGYTKFLLDSEKVMGYAITRWNGGYLNLSIRVLGITTITCGNASGLQIFFKLRVIGSLPSWDFKDLVLSLRGENSSMFYGFLLSQNRAKGAVEWQASGWRDQAWSPRTAYDGFTLQNPRFDVQTQVFLRITRGTNTLKITARVLGGNEMRATIDLILSPNIYISPGE